MPSYHDLYITTPDVPRTSIFNLPYSVLVQCTRAGGWEVWEIWDGKERKLGSELGEENGLILDVNGYVIVDSLSPVIKEFIVEGVFKCPLGIVHSGRAPFDMLDRKVKGKHVLVDGVTKTIKYLESYALLQGPKEGDPIGLIFEEMENV